MKSLRFLVMAAMCLPLPALAADVDYSRVINLAGKQRMLTQKMSKEVEAWLRLRLIQLRT